MCVFVGSHFTIFIFLFIVLLGATNKSDLSTLLLPACLTFLSQEHACKPTLVFTVNLHRVYKYNTVRTCWIHRWQGQTFIILPECVLAQMCEKSKVGIGVSTQIYQDYWVSHFTTEWIMLFTFLLAQQSGSHTFHIGCPVCVCVGVCCGGYSLQRKQMLGGRACLK